jgi:hypothetical protein
MFVPCALAIDSILLLCNAHNLALVRRFAINILNCEHTFKASLKQKSKRAAMDNNYMLTLLSATFPALTATA